MVVEEFKVELMQMKQLLEMVEVVLITITKLVVAVVEKVDNLVKHQIVVEVHKDQVVQVVVMELL